MKTSCAPNNTHYNNTLPAGCLTLACVSVCTAASTLAKLPLPRVVPVRRYLPIHLTCLDELVLDEVEAVLADEGGLGGKLDTSDAAPLP